MFEAAPDVCATPPLGVMVPYVDLAFNAMAATFAPNVLTAMLPTLTLTSMIPLSTGDEAGSMHWTYTGLAMVTQCLFPVLVNNLPVATLCAGTIGNDFNAPVGSIVVPSQANILVGHAGSG